jgi:hypothetical protein
MATDVIIPALGMTQFLADLARGLEEPLRLSVPIVRETSR